MESKISVKIVLYLRFFHEIPCSGLSRVAEMIDWLID